MARKKSRENEKKFNRNVEISAPILDPEVIKAIHSPKFGNLDLKQAGFKALLAGLSSQDSTEDVVPVCDQNHVPSYIGISCAISGYSNYSKYNKTTGSQLSADSKRKSFSRNSRPTSPQHQKHEQNNKDEIPINHITVEKKDDPEQELKELTDKLTASVADRRRSPSPSVHPANDGRHHGAYVGARYCPMPSPSQEVVKHIPLLGIDDEQDPEEALAEQAKTQKVENKIASIYGDEFVEDWKESMMHKNKKELPPNEEQTENCNVKYLVSLKPTPIQEPLPEEETIEIEKPNVKVMEKVETSFLTKIMSGLISPKKKSPASSRPTSPESTAVSNPTSPSKSPKKSSKSNTPTPSPTKQLDIDVKNSIKDKPINNADIVADNIDEPVKKEEEAENVLITNQQESLTQEPEKKLQDDDQNLSNHKAGQQYLETMDAETSNIKAKIFQAEQLLKEENLSEESIGMIMSAIGKANLLINDKFSQFKTICNENIQQVGTERYATLNNDLEGFWDMVMLQVNEVYKTFDFLFKASENNWQIESDEHEQNLPSITKSKDVKQVSKPKLDPQKDNDRRKKLQEHISQMKAAAAKTTQNVDEQSQESLTESRVLEEENLDTSEQKPSPPEVPEQENDEKLISLS